MNFPLDHLPYLCLAFTILVAWQAGRSYSLIAAGFTLVAALVAGRIQPIALIPIFILGSSLFLAEEKLENRKLRTLCYTIFLVVSFALSNHLFPGFNNLKIFDSIRFATDSSPFSMYLNFDKTFVGFFILMFFLRRDSRVPSQKDLELTFRTWILLTTLMMSIALSVGYVRFDPKVPDLAWIWALNNLLFVCLSEEALFRGLIQGGLARLISPTNTMGRILPVVVSAILFGAAHFRGGLVYMILAAIAGCFYGYVYLRTQRIECAMLTHFGLNLTHFFLFSYPALAKI